MVKVDLLSPPLEEKGKKKIDEKKKKELVAFYPASKLHSSRLLFKKLRRPEKELF